MGGGHCTAAYHPRTREPTPKMALSLLSINSVIPFIKRADHRRDRAARIIHNKGAPRTYLYNRRTNNLFFLVPGPRLIYSQDSDPSPRRVTRSRGSLLGWH